MGDSAARMLADEIVQNGIPYVACKIAGKRVGLSGDYIARFCREGLVACARSGGAWYVSETSLSDYLADQERKQEEYRRRLSEEANRATGHADANSARVSISPHPDLHAHTARIRPAPKPVEVLLATLAIVAVTVFPALAFQSIAPEKFATTIDRLAATPRVISSQIAAASSLPWLDALASNIYRAACPFVSDCAKASDEQTDNFAAAQNGNFRNDDSDVRSLSANSLPRRASATTSTPTVINQYITQQPIVERTLERVVERVSPAPLAGYVTREEWQSQLAALQQQASANSRAVESNWNALALSTRVESLSGTTLSNPTITGGSITSSSVTGTLTNVLDSVSGAIASLTGSDLTYTRATFTNSTTTNATTTNLAVTGNATLPTTNLTGDLTISGALTVSGAQTLSGAITVPYITATSTTQASDFQKFTATHATTTSLFVNSLLSSPTATFGALTATSSLAVSGTASFSNSSNFFGLTSFGATATTTIATNGAIFTPSITANAATAYQASIGSLTATSSLLATNASTTLLSSLDALYVGRTATTTIRGDGVASTLPYASSTALTISGTAYFPGSGIWNSSGNVGIGTASPDIYGLGSSRVLGLQSSGTTVSLQAITSGSKGFFTEGTGSLARFVGYQVPLYIDTNGSFDVVFRPNTTEAMRILASNGNVGIGTTNPDAKLDVSGALHLGQGTDLGAAKITHHTNNYLYVTGGTAGAVLSDNGFVNTARVVDGAAGYFSVETGDGTERLRVNASGNLGLGNTSPTYKLDVTGLGRFTGLVDAANFVATSTSATSTFAGGVSLGNDTIRAYKTGKLDIGDFSMSGAALNVYKNFSSSVGSLAAFQADNLRAPGDCDHRFRLIETGRSD